MSEPDIDFLTDEAPEVVETEAVETTPEAATVAKPETPAPEVPTTPEPQEDRVPKAALIAERKKRQEYEARLREIEAQHHQQPAPNFYEAPERYVNEVVGNVQRQMHVQMLSALEAQAREVYPDYDEVFQIVQESAEQNPVIVQQIMQAPNPAMAAYKLGKQLREMQAMQDPDAYRSKIEADMRAKIEAEYRAKDEAKLKAANAIPPDLTAARAARDDEVPPDDSLESILKSS